MDYDSTSQLQNPLFWTGDKFRTQWDSRKNSGLGCLDDPLGRLAVVHSIHLSASVSFRQPLME